MAPVKVILSLLAALGTLPTLTAGVDLRRYANQEPCTASRFIEYRNALSRQCVNMGGGRFHAFSCYGCDGFDTHAIYTRSGNADCATARVARSGANPNCIVTSRTDITGHRYCDSCTVRRGVLVDRDTEEEIDCEGQADADLLYIDGRAFELADMSAELKEELEGFLFDEELVDIPEKFDVYENSTYVYRR